MITTHGTAVVPAAPADVHALLVDPARTIDLAPHPVEIVSSEVLPDGRRVTRTRTRLPSGATVEAENVVIDQVPDRRVVTVNSVEPFGFAPSRRARFGSAVTRIERTLEPHPDGTLVTDRVEIRIAPALLRAYFTFAKRGQWQRATDDGLERLRTAFSPAPPARGG